MSRRPAASPVAADAIVVAAGASRRMGGVDKLFAPIAGRPLLAWTLAGVAAAPGIERIVVVAAPERLAEIAAADWLPPSVVAVVAGGARRQDSVAAGFAALEGVDREDARDDDRPILVHDAARPLVSATLVAAVARAAARYGAAIPVVPLSDTLKELDGDRVVATVDRSRLAAAQTPQGVRRGLLRRAYRDRPSGVGPELTDEAALLEACRIPVHAIPGEPMNLKVTLPEDLRRVEAALGSHGIARTGIGVDRHPFGHGAPLRLAGVEIDGAPRLHGHSDGDVALHAVADALLGAAALGDLGRLFPADRRTPHGVDSRSLLAEVVRSLAEAGWQPRSVDLTIEGARPRLADHLEAMRVALAGQLGVHPGVISVKAATGNLIGSDGAGRSMAAHAIATITRIEVPAHDQQDRRDR